MKKEFEKALAYIKNKTDADDFVVHMGKADAYFARFAQNSMTQHNQGEGIGIHLEVSYGDKSGSASANSLDENTLEHLLSQSSAIAKMNEPDPEHLVSLNEEKIPRVENSGKTTKFLKPKELVTNVQECINFAKKKNALLSGITERQITLSFLATKNGFQGYEEFTSFEHSMTIKKEAAETKVSRSYKDYGDFSLPTELDRLNKQLDALSTSQRKEAGKMNVILMPEAAFEFFSMMAWYSDRRSTDEGMTPFTGKIGSECFGKKFSFSSDFSDKRLLSPSFGYEGVNKPTIWVKDGILHNLPCDRYWAQKNNLQRASYFNYCFSGEGKSIEEMMKIAGSGLIINNFWYIRSVDRKAGEFTGMTRDGVLYFENGEVKHAVHNFRWNEIPHACTKRLLATGTSEIIHSTAKIPAMLIEDFNLVDVTSF